MLDVDTQGGYRASNRHNEFADGQNRVLPLFDGQHLPQFLAPQLLLPTARGLGGLLAKNTLRPSHIRTILEDRSSSPAPMTQIPANPLHSRAIEEACTAGCHHYLMVESGQSASLAQLMSRFGAKAYDYAEYQFERVPPSWLKEGASNLAKRMIGFRDV
jgi:hypothetical protein